VASHLEWAADIEETHGYKISDSMIAHSDLKVAKFYDMLPTGSKR
jgi:alkyl hydroperoxide reductase subunit AhpC